MENIAANRVPAGIHTGGRFAPAQHHEPALTLIPAPIDGPDFDSAFEKTRGAELTKELLALPAVSTRAAINASRTSDLLRESYPEYWADDTAPRTRTQAVKSLEAALPNLSAERRGEFIELMRFAVHEEMKHYADTAYVSNPEHGYELLVEAADYDSEEDWATTGQDDNRARWELLADTAAFHALSADRSYSVPEAA